MTVQRMDQPPAAIEPASTLGMCSVMFTVTDIADVVARLRAHGADPVGDVAGYEDRYRLCYVRGPASVTVLLPLALALAQEL